jgi:hypothetical protein
VGFEVQAILGGKILNSRISFAKTS